MPKILIVGATGQQGSAVVNALLASGSTDLEIRALTRNPSSSTAQALKKRGVEPVKGDLLDRNSLVNALTGCDAAYLVTDFRGPEDTEGELKQGRQFVDVASEVGIQHLVFSSVAGADQTENLVDHFHTKYQIEQHVRGASAIPRWTIVRPVGFMEVLPPLAAGNITRFFFWSAFAALMGDTKQKYVACADIGRAVAMALREPERFHGRTLTLCGQVASLSEAVNALERGEGRKGWGWVPWVPRGLVRALTPFHYRQMFDWLYYENCQPGSPEETREVLGEVMDIETWARRRQAEREMEG